MVQSLNIAVVGAGIMGLNAAHALQKNHHVTLYEREKFPVKNASYMAGGLLAPFAEIEHMSEDLIRAGFASMKIWQEILPSLKQHVGFFQKGSLLVAHKEDAHMLERFAQKLPPQQSWKNAGREDIKALEPELERFEKGIYLPEEAQIYAMEAMHALYNALQHRILETGDIEKLKDNHDWVIDCRGYGAGNDDPELRGVKGEIITVRNPEFTLQRPVRLMHPRYPFYIVPRGNHEFLIGATLIESADTNVTLKSTLELLSAAYSLHTSFAEAKIVEMQAGIRPAYPDNMPRITITGNVIRCNGLFRHGYLVSPVMAQCVADYIIGNNNEFSPVFARKA